VSPLGLTVKDTWDGILAGRSGIAPITHFDVTTFATRFGGSVRNFDASQYIPAKDVKKMDAFIHYGIAAGIEAIKDSGIVVTEENAENIGVAIGSGIGGLGGIERGYEAFTNGGPRKISPFFVPSNIINMISGNLSVMFGMKGPNFAVVTACATGTHSIGEAARKIALDEADVMIAGGAEMATSPTGLGGFSAARALSQRNDDPQTASRPWDKDRDGFVLSDGAGVVVLEEYEMAKKRGAKIYAEVIGYGMSGDAYHMTSPPPKGEGAQRCMRAALKDAGIAATDIQYINAHGTSTPAGDLAECDAAKAVFGDYAYKLMMSSTKSMTGHMLGAAGGIEAVFCALALHQQVAPPTINIFNRDPECDLDFVPHEARSVKLTTVLSNSFGFGGTNGTLILRKI
jgi:3-oxoacyl-[acyl-carrier-protein] synthase II